MALLGEMTWYEEALPTVPLDATGKWKKFNHHYHHLPSTTNTPVPHASQACGTHSASILRKSVVWFCNKEGTETQKGTVTVRAPGVLFALPCPLPACTPSLRHSCSWERCSGSSTWHAQNWDTFRSHAWEGMTRSCWRIGENLHREKLRTLRQAMTSCLYSPLVFQEVKATGAISKSWRLTDSDAQRLRVSSNWAKILVPPEGEIRSSSAGLRLLQGPSVSNTNRKAALEWSSVIRAKRESKK